MSTVYFRIAMTAHLSDIVSIENASFPFPWTEDDFVRCLRQKNIIGLIAEHRGRVLGYAVYELCKDWFHVLNLAVSPGFRRCGIGGQIVERIASRACQSKRKRLIVEVHEANLDAQLFFRALGFRATEVCRDFYEACDGDAYRMEFQIGGLVATY